MSIKNLLWASALFVSFTAVAQTDGQLPESTQTPSATEAEVSATPKAPIVNLDGIARIDWQYHHPDGRPDDSQTGFEGQYLMFRVDGEIVPGLTYSWRQRLNKALISSSFFDATDWVYLDYAYKGWDFSAGKQIVAIGGFEYDRAPFNLYGCSVFWNNIPCYQLGASVGYNIGGSDKVMVQATQSPFASAGNRNMYSYNVMWSSQHEWYQSLWSANMVEYAKGRYISYLALGNRFSVDRWSLELDLMNRAASHQAYLFKDCSIMAELAFEAGKHWRLHGKFTYDINKSGSQADMLVLHGTRLAMAGGGVEYYPLLKHRTSLRIHAAAYYSWGKNANTADLMQSRTVLASVGITWYMNILNIQRKH